MNKQMKIKTRLNTTIMEKDLENNIIIENLINNNLQQNKIIN